MSSVGELFDQTGQTKQRLAIVFLAVTLPVTIAAMAVGLAPLAWVAPLAFLTAALWMLAEVRREGGQSAQR